MRSRRRRHGRVPAGRVWRVTRRTGRRFLITRGRLLASLAGSRAARLAASPAGSLLASLREWAVPILAGG
jgi:hypothetical protein